MCATYDNQRHLNARIYSCYFCPIAQKTRIYLKNLKPEKQLAECGVKVIN